MSQMSLLHLPPVNFRAAERKIFRGKPRFSTYDWATRNMRIVAGPYRGQRWNPDVTPYARGVFDIFDRETVNKMFLIWSSQLAKTTIALICLFAEQARRLDNICIGYPDMMAAKKVLTGIIHPYYEQVDVLRTFIGSEDALQNYEIRHVDGSKLYAMWSGSDSSQRSISAARVLIDEEDTFADKSSVLAMQERVTSYEGLGLSKIIRCCRPQGNEEESTIWADARKEAQAWMRFEVACPFCGHRQIMDDGRIVSANGSRSASRITAEKLGRYQCESCEKLWNDAHRDMALRGGRWTASEGTLEGAKTVAFHLRAWESTLVSLSKVLAERIQAQKDPRRMQTYVNNVQAQPYKFVTMESDAERLARHIDPNLPQGLIPDWAIALTLAVDMQRNHFWFSVAAHGLEPERIHILDYGRVQSFEEVEALAFQNRYEFADGISFGSWRGALDTGGGLDPNNRQDTRPMQAQRWLNGIRPGVVHGTKGMSRNQPGVFVKISQPDKAGTLHKGRTAAIRSTPLYLLDTDSFKRLVFWRLGEGEQEEPITFHAQTGADYLKQIASEKLIQKPNGHEEWHKFRDNHYLDCLVQHLAMGHWQWQPRLAMRKRRETTVPVPQPSPTENPFTQGTSLFGG